MMVETKEASMQLGRNSSGEHSTMQTFKRRRRPVELENAVTTAIGPVPPSAPAAEPAPKRAKLTAPAKAKKQLTQVHLDLGQKNFHSTQCPTCGLIYTPGKASDDRLHAAYHSKHAAPPRYSKSKDDTVAASDGTTGDIVRLSTTSSTKTMKELVSSLEVELGLVPGWLLAVPGTAFFYVCRKTKIILGCIIAENITEGWEASVGEHAEPQASGDSGSTISSDECSGSLKRGLKRAAGVVVVDKETTRRARHGIRIMWTAASARRKSIASKLLDCARCQLVRGYVVPKDGLAFSQPTAAGAAFIQAYSKTDKFLVYDAKAR